MPDETKKISKCPKCDVKLVNCEYQKDALECKGCGRLYDK